MNLKSITRSLLFWIVVAIVLGIACSFIFPVWLARIFITFNGLFSNFLGFFVPVLIFALITPAIAGLGKGAGKWLGLTAGIAYSSTIISGLIAWGLSVALYPWLLGDQKLNTAIEDVEEGALSPFFEVEIDPPFAVMTALVLAFCVGISMTAVKSDTMYKLATEFENVIMKVVTSFVIPLLPLFIFGMFLNLGMNENMGSTLAAFGKVLLLSVIMTVLLLIVQYLIAGIVAGVNPVRALGNMLPAYFTALGTSSSAATIPVTLRSTMNNKVDENVAGFVVPLCATIHLSGSMMKIGLYAFAVIYMAGMDVSWGLSLGFILLLGIMMIAAPGVPGGAIMAATGLLASMLGFNDEMVGLMIAAYIVIDSFGTAANVTGDGAIALVVNRFAAGKIEKTHGEQEHELIDDPTVTA